MDQSRGAVLVTGGAGYIGSHACKELALRGYLPIVYDNLNHGHDWAVKWGPLERGDVGDGTRLKEVFARHAPTAVMHFAAFAYVGESVTDPGKYFRNNVVGSLTLLETMRSCGCSKFIFSSTCATYGIPDRLPISEDAPQRPINPYGASKVMVERMLADFGQAHGIQWVTLRYFNAAGADPGGDLGEQHDPETHLIPLVLEAASGRRASVPIFGTDYDTPDGTCVRDYVHVTDLADAHVLALEALEGGAAPTAYNLGVGQGYSVQQVIAAAARITGRHVPVRVCGRRPGDAPALVSEASKVRAALGWEPRLSDLDQIIQTAWTWHLGCPRGDRIVRCGARPRSLQKVRPTLKEP